MSEKYEKLVEKATNLTDVLISELDLKEEETSLPLLKDYVNILQNLLKEASRKRVIDSQRVDATDFFAEWEIFSRTNITGTKYLIRYYCYDRHLEYASNDIEVEYDSLLEALAEYGIINERYTLKYSNELFPEYSNVVRDYPDKEVPYQRYLDEYPEKVYCPDAHK